MRLLLIIVAKKLFFFTTSKRTWGGPTSTLALQRVFVFSSVSLLKRLFLCPRLSVLSLCMPVRVLCTRMVIIQCCSFSTEGERMDWVLEYWMIDEWMYPWWESKVFIGRTDLLFTKICTMYNTCLSLWPVFRDCFWSKICQPHVCVRHNFNTYSILIFHNV